MRRSLEVRSKNREEAIKKALIELNVEKEDLEIEEIEQPIKGFLGFLGSKEGLYKFTVIEKECDIAKQFIENMLKNANVNANVNITQENNLIKVDIEGKEAACLIGRRGETLDSIQFLTGLALNKINKDSHMRVLVDIENYRSKREESLIRYAVKTSFSLGIFPKTVVLYILSKVRFLKPCKSSFSLSSERAKIIIPEVFLSNR